jgi:hypothetical protein
MAGVISPAEPTVRIVVFLPYPSRDTGGWQVTVPDYRWGGGMGGINRRTPAGSAWAAAILIEDRSRLGR